jgi:Type I restriction enzyme R protein N terminus (HSDR_N)
LARGPYLGAWHRGFAVSGEKLFDPIRRREVDGTPEEHVRQALVSYFLDVLKVPPRLLAVEFDLRKVNPSKRGRLDVIAFKPSGGFGLEAWAIAECKAPEIEVDEKVARQLERYLSILPCRYLMATNGRQSVVLEVEGSATRRIVSLPLFAPG